MAEIDLDTLLKLCGSLDTNDRASESFRSYISNSKQVSNLDLENWLKKCNENRDRNYAYAFQDLVNEIGERLGFRVQFGPYRGTPEKPGYDGIWISDKTGSKLVVESKKTNAYTVDPQKLHLYMESVAKEKGWSLKEMNGLYVYGEEPGTIIDTIRGSDFRNDIRATSYQNLFTLLRLKEDTGFDHVNIVKFLIPMDTINIGELVRLVDEIVTVMGAKEQSPTYESKATGKEEAGQGTTVTDKSDLKKVPQASRHDIINKYVEGLTVICPADEDGPAWLWENKAWG